MINYVKKSGPQLSHIAAEDNRFEQIRRAAAEQHKKSHADGARSSVHQSAEDNGPV